MQDKFGVVVVGQTMGSTGGQFDRYTLAMLKDSSGQEFVDILSDPWKFVGQ